MNKEIFDILLLWPKPYISGTDLHHILDKSSYSRQAIIKRARQKGLMTQIRRDLYLINRPGMHPINSFEIAPIIYGPAYISFESALSYHGWIPEAVRTITCASTKRAQEFETPLGIFSYEHIPIKAFSLGIEQYEKEGSTLFIAAPMKAIADMIYARKKLWKTIDDLCEDLRIEPDSIKKSDKQLLTTLAENYPSVRVKQAVNLLKMGL